MENGIPTNLIDLLGKQYDMDILNRILKGYREKRYTTFRINNLKANICDIEKQLKKENIKLRQVQYYKNAFIVENADEKQIEQLDAYKNGQIYIQSLSSMLPPLILDPKPGENILDMTAAPGSKTTQIASISNNKALITACEKNPIRAQRLKYNIEKQGAEKICLIVKNACMLDDFFSFDKILLDAPCTGSGTLQEGAPKYTEKEFTKEAVNKMSQRQFALLKKAISILKPGNEMIYSTCSILEEENEKVIYKILDTKVAEIVPIHIENLPLLPTKLNGCICVCPTKEYEGFFMAKIKKKKLSYKMD